MCPENRNCSTIPRHASNFALGCCRSEAITVVHPQCVRRVHRIWKVALAGLSFALYAGLLLLILGPMQWLPYSLRPLTLFMSSQNGSLDTITRPSAMDVL